MIEHVRNKMLNVIVSPGRRFVYFKVAKTAGTSIHWGLMSEEVGDLCWQSSKKKDAEIDSRFGKWADGLGEDGIARHFKFVIVRNPWDRMISNYYYLKRIHSLSQSFPDFLKAVWRGDFNLSRNPRYNHSIKVHVWPQLPYFMLDGVVFVDFIARFESLGDDWPRIKERCGLNGELPLLNRGRHPSYVECYNDERIEMVYEMYKEEIDYLGYKFGNDEND